MRCVIGSSALVGFDFISWHSSPIKINSQAPAGSIAKSVHWTLFYAQPCAKIFFGRERKKTAMLLVVRAACQGFWKKYDLCFYKKRRPTLVRWRFFSKPEGLDLYRLKAEAFKRQNFIQLHFFLEWNRCWKYCNIKGTICFAVFFLFFFLSFIISKMIDFIWFFLIT